MGNKKGRCRIKEELKTLMGTANPRYPNPTLVPEEIGKKKTRHRKNIFQKTAMLKKGRMKIEWCRSRISQGNQDFPPYVRGKRNQCFILKLIKNALFGSYVTYVFKAGGGSKTITDNFFFRSCCKRNLCPLLFIRFKGGLEGFFLRMVVYEHDHNFV